MKKSHLILSGVALVVGANFAQADSVVTNEQLFTGSEGSLAASAFFQRYFDSDTNEVKWVITLENTSSADALVPADLLTGLRWNMSVNETLTKVSAMTPSDTTFLNNTQASSGNLPASGAVDVGGEFAYVGGLTRSFDGVVYKYGVSSAGLVEFGVQTDLFSPLGDLDWPVSPDGPNFGITSDGDDINTGNSVLHYDPNKNGTNPNGTVPIIKNSVVFTLTGLDPAATILGVQFVYGTQYGEGDYPSDQNPPPPGPPFVPTPAAALMALPLLGLFGLGRPRRLLEQH